MNTDRSFPGVPFSLVRPFLDDIPPERQVHPPGKKPRTAAEVDRLRLEVAASMVAAAFLLAGRPAKNSGHLDGEAPPVQ